MDFKNFLENTNWRDQLDDAHDFNSIMAILRQNGAINPHVPRLLKKILVFDMDGELYVIDDFDYPNPIEAKDWLGRQAGEADQYIKPLDSHTEFWRGVGQGSAVYHGTYDKDWKEIQAARKLVPRNRTRGLANRNIPPAIFASSEYETALSGGYNVILEIKVGDMKADGYMPRVSKETPVEDGELESALAWAIGIEDYEPEYESGLDPGTVVFYQEIPIKYVERIK